MNKLFLLSIVSVCFLFLYCEDYTDDFNFLNEEIERLTSENTDLKSIISDNTNAANPTAIDDIEQQMKNCYADLKKILDHYNASFEDVIVENIFTTDMKSFLEVASYRNEIYTKNFPTGSWLGVKELAFPEFMIEIELEVHLE